MCRLLYRVDIVITSKFAKGRGWPVAERLRGTSRIGRLRECADVIQAAAALECYSTRGGVVAVHCLVTINERGAIGVYRRRGGMHGFCQGDLAR